MAWNLIRPNNEEIYAKRLQLKELLADELEATELIAKKIRSAIGGKSMSVWDAGESYDIGDLTFYNGCLYSSLIDSNVSTPAPASPDWIKVSRVKNSRLYFVDNIAGDDTKATNECADYSFFSLDGCIDYVTATHPAGNVSIVLLNTGINYTLSRDITLNEFTISAVDSAPRSHAHFIQIDVQNTILITGNNVSFNGLGMTYDDTTAPANMFIFEGGVFGIFDCRLVKLDPANSLMVLRSTATPGWTRNDVYLIDTIRSGKVGGGNFVISFDDSSGVPYVGELQIRGSLGWTINENLNPAVSAYGASLIRTNDTEISIASIVVSSFIGLNCNFFNFTNSANSPAYIGLVGCNTHATFGPGYFTFSKTGTADYIFTMCDFGPSPTIAAGATRSEYQSGYPLHYHHANNKYQQHDVVFSNGCAYSSLTNNNTVTPSESDPNWLKISNVKDPKLYYVNNIIGDNTKALNDCANYPFFSLDSAIDAAVADHPAGNVVIFLAVTGVDYTLSRDLTLNNFVLSIEPDSNRREILLNVNVQNSILITGDNIVLSKIEFVYDDTAVPDNMFIIESGFLRFSGCRLQKVSATNSLMILRSTTRVGWTKNDVFIDETNSVGTRVISFDDTSGVSYGGTLTIRNSTGWTVTESLNPVVTPVGTSMLVFIDSVLGINITSMVCANLIAINSILGGFTHTADAPAYITLRNCGSRNVFDNIFYAAFNKTGTANYYIVGCDLGPSANITAGANRSSYTSGLPLHNYHANNTYNDTDIVFSGGDVYRCRVTPTTGITPGTDFTRWLPLTQFNQGSSWGAPLGAFTTLTTGLTVTSDKLNLPTLLADPYVLLSTVTANSFRIVKPGLYQIVMNLETTTTQVAGQDTIHDISIGLSSDSNVANSLSRVSGQRGLVSNSTTYPINDSRLTLSLSLPTGSPNLNVDLSIYCRTTGTNAYNALIVKFFVERKNPL